MNIYGSIPLSLMSVMSTPPQHVQTKLNGSHPQDRKASVPGFILKAIAGCFIMGKPLIKMDDLRVPQIIENLPGKIAGYSRSGFFLQKYVCFSIFCRSIVYISWI